MVHLFRNYQRPLMVVITVLIIIAFGLLYNGTQLDRIGIDRAYRIYGKALTQQDVERAARRFHLAQALGLNELVMGLAGNAFSENQAAENFIWNSYVLTHEADRLRIKPTTSEIAARMRELPGLQTNGQFDRIKYQEFVTNLLIPNGFDTTQLESLVSDELRLRKLMGLLGSTVDATPAEFRTLYTRGHQKTQSSIVRFKLDEFTQSIEPTAEQIEKFYNDNLANLNTEERRTVSFVEIGLNEEEQKLTGRERVEALSRQSDRADNFGQELLKEGVTFAQAAEKMGLKVVEAGEFSRTEPPAALSTVPQAVNAAFLLTEEARESNPLESENGLVVLHLDKITPSRPLTLEEAKPRIIAAIKEEQGRNDLTAKANEVRSKIEAGLAEKKSFSDAVAAAGVSAEQFPAFSMAEPVQQPDAFQIAEASMEIPVGGLSRVLPTEGGALLLYIDQRDPVDEAKMAADEVTQLPGLRQFKRYAVFNDWLRTQLQIANPHSIRPPRPDETGQPGNNG